MSLVSYLKRAVNRSLNNLGYEIRRPSYGHQDDAFEAQRVLAGDARTIFDVGAHVGQSAVRYRALFPRATIHCFEPFPESFRSLQALASTDALVRANCLALAEQPGMRTLYANHVSTTNSLLPLDEVAEEHIDPRLYGNVDVVEVEVDTIDAYVQRHGLGPIDILKMDVQGGEMGVLRGCQASLQSVRLVYCEVQFAPVYRNQARFVDINQTLEQAGFVLYGLYDLNYGRTGALAWCDALYKRTP